MQNYNMGGFGDGESLRRRFVPGNLPQQFVREAESCDPPEPLLESSCGTSAYAPIYICGLQVKPTPDLITKSGKSPAAEDTWQNTIL